MNCKDWQKKTVVALAACDSLLLPELLEHQQACQACRKFYELQSVLLGSVESGLQTMVNQEMPPSLLPILRTRLSQPPASNRSWIHAFSFAVVVSVIVLIIASVHRVQPRRETVAELPQKRSLVSSSVGNSARTVQSARKSMVVSRGRAPKRAQSSVAASPSESLPEVIVLAEERQAFCRFVADLPREKDVAPALTQPAQKAENVSIEIALLEISTLEVKPLEAMPRE